MTTPQQEYPPGTVLADMLIDIYASKKREDIWIMHDKAFETKLIRLELSPATKELDFVFEGEEVKNLGAPLRDALVPHFEKVKEITFYEIDLATKQPKSHLTVPIEVKNEAKD